MNEDREKFLNTYDFDIDGALAQGAKKLAFDGYDQAWLDFVVGNRRGETLWRPYDIIVGGIANDRVFNTVELYATGLIISAEALQRLRYHEPNNQICILRQSIIDRHLRFVGGGKAGREMIKDNPLINKTLLQMKFARIIVLLARRLDISQPRALALFYSTHVYQYMCDLKYHLHNMGDEYCADEVMLELQSKQ